MSNQDFDWASEKASFACHRDAPVHVEQLVTSLATTNHFHCTNGLE